MSRLVLLLGIVSSAAVYWRGNWKWSVVVALMALLLSVLIGASKDLSGGWILVSALVASIAVGCFAGLYVEGTKASAAFGAGIGLAICTLGITAGWIPGVAMYRVLDDGIGRSLSRYIGGFMSSSLGLPWWLDDILLGSCRSIQVIRNGHVSLSAPPSSSIHVLGPGLVIIGSGNAAVFERSGTITRIEGPGVVLTERFECLKAIVDLRLQTSVLREIRAETRDGISIKFHPTMHYRVKIDEDELAAEGGYAFDAATIRRAALGATDWRAQTETAAKRIVCEVTGCYALDDLYEPSNTSSTPPLSSTREVLHSEIVSRVNAACAQWGVIVTDLQLGEIDIPEEVRQRMLERWDVGWKRWVEEIEAETARLVATTLIATQHDAVIQKGAAQARVMRTMEKIKAAARAEIIRQISSAISDGGRKPDHETTIRYIDAIEKVTRGFVSDPQIAMRYIESLEALASSPNAKLIVSPPGTRLIVGSEPHPSTDRESKTGEGN